MNPLRFLAGCGIASSCLASAGGLSGHTVFIGLAGLVMLTGNLYALIHKGQHGNY